MIKEPVESLYLPVVNAISMRVAIGEQALDLVHQKADDPTVIGNCETAVLQIRLICELLLLGSVAAHLHEAGLEIDDSKWRPKDSFHELAKLNEHPLQLPIEVHLNHNGDGLHHVVPSSKPVPFDKLHKIYGICGDLLHVPTLKQVSADRVPDFDVPLISGWLSGLRQIALGHALMLPERQIIMLSTWTGEFGDPPLAYRLDALGPSTLDLSSYPEFSLF